MSKKQNKPIGVRVVYPTTPEGIAAMNERLEQINTWLLCSFLDKIDAPTSAKLAYVESLDGIAPWATVRGNSQT